jgi:hypothetical protein
MKKIILSFLSVCVLAVLACAKQVNLVCPDVIEVNESISQPLGWEGFVESDALTLERVGVYSGHPRDKAALVPDNEDEIQAKQFVWTLVPNSKEGYWVACFYNGTRAMLVKQVPSNAKKCVVEYNTLENGELGKPQKIIFK